MWTHSVSVIKANVIPPPLQKLQEYCFHISNYFLFNPPILCFIVIINLEYPYENCNNFHRVSLVAVTYNTNPQSGIAKSWIPLDPNKVNLTHLFVINKFHFYFNKQKLSHYTNTSSLLPMVSGLQCNTCIKYHNVGYAEYVYKYYNIAYCLKNNEHFTQQKTVYKHVNIQWLVMLTTHLTFNEIIRGGH